MTKEDREQLAGSCAGLGIGCGCYGCGCLMVTFFLCALIWAVRGFPAFWGAW